MCNFKSAFVVKPAVEGARPEILHVPGVDSHSEIAERLKIHDRQSASAQDLLTARVEFTPDWAKDITQPEAWTLKLDEERKPEWWTDQVEDQVRSGLWAIVLGMLLTSGSHEKVGGEWLVCGLDTELKITDGAARVHQKATVTAWGSSTVTARGSSTVTARGSSTVTAWGSSTVTARDSSTVTAWGSSTVTAWGSSTVTAWGSSTVTAWGSSTVTAWGSSTVTAWGSSTVTAWGSSTVTAWDSSTVTAWGSSTVTAWGSSTVTIESSYAYALGRGWHDGNGFPVLLASALVVGHLYRIRDNKFIGEPKPAAKV